MLPSSIAVRSCYDTPSVGIFVSTVVVLSLTTFGFVDIVQLLNSVYCLALLVEFATLIRLRRICGHMERPFKIPLGIVGLTVMVIPAVITVLAILVVPPLYGEYMTTYYAVMGTLISVIAYEIVELGRRLQWFLFCADPPRDADQVLQKLKVF